MSTLTKDRVQSLLRSLARYEDLLDNAVSIHHEDRIKDTIRSIQEQIDQLRTEE